LRRLLYLLLRRSEVGKRTREDRIKCIVKFFRKGLVAEMMHTYLVKEEQQLHCFDKTHAVDIKVRHCWNHLLKARYAIVPAVATTAAAANPELYSSTRDMLQPALSSARSLQSPHKKLFFK